MGCTSGAERPVLRAGPGVRADLGEVGAGRGAYRGADLGAAQWWVVRVAAESSSPPPRSGWQPPFTPLRLSGMGYRETGFSPGRGRSTLPTQPHPAAPGEYLS